MDRTKQNCQMASRHDHRSCKYFFDLFFLPICDGFGSRKPRHLETISAKKRYTLIHLYRSTWHFRRFWVKEPCHSETISAKKRYTLIPLYRSMRHCRRFWVKEALPFRNPFSQKTVYLNTWGLRAPVIQKQFQPKKGIP